MTGRAGEEQPEPGLPSGHEGLRRLLSGRVPAAVETAHWPQGMTLRVATYLGEGDVPPELVVSVRCVVTVGRAVLVCEDATPSCDVLPGGRCEPGESWRQTAQREVREETGWHVDPDQLTPLGFIHLRHLTPVPPGHPFPQPDFLNVVLHGVGTGSPVGWVDLEGWVQRSRLMPYAAAAGLPLSAAGSVFLAAVAAQQDGD